MAAEQPYLPRSGVDEHTIVGEMTRNRDSEHWKQCDEFVRQWVDIKAKAQGLSWDSKEVIRQEVMDRVYKNLPNFRFEGSLRAWVHQIISRCIIDELRYIKREEQHHIVSWEKLTEDDPEDEEPQPLWQKPLSIENSFEQKEKTTGWVAALLEYANTHRNPVRDRQIIKMVLFEEHTQTEAARAVGLSPADVHYVIEQAQRYAREKLDH